MSRVCLSATPMTLAARPLHHDHGMRIMFITDHDDDLVLYRVGLQAEGIAVATAMTVDEAIFIAGIRHFDAIVLVVVAPNGDGWKPCQVLRAHPATSALPLVVLSASVRSDRINRDRARQLGCAAFVAKPCTPPELASVLRRVVAGERDIEELDGDGVRDLP